MFDDDEPKDWEELDEEVPPEHLQRKWDNEEPDFHKTTTCPGCKQLVSADVLTCAVCGAQVFRESGFLRKLLKWITGK